MEEATQTPTQTDEVNESTISPPKEEVSSVPEPGEDKQQQQDEDKGVGSSSSKNDESLKNKKKPRVTLEKVTTIGDEEHVYLKIEVDGRDSDSSKDDESDTNTNKDEEGEDDEDEKTSKENDKEEEHELTKDEVLIVFGFSGVLATFHNHSKHYFEIPDIINECSKYARLAVVTPDPTAVPTLNKWNIASKFDAIRAGSNKSWEAGQYDETMKIGASNCAQIKDMLSNELSAFSFKQILYFVEMKESVDALNINMPQVKVVPQSRFIGLDEMDLVKSLERYERPGIHSLKASVETFRQMMENIFAKDSAEALSKKELILCIGPICTRFLGEIQVREQKLSRFRFEEAMNHLFNPASDDTEKSDNQDKEEGAKQPGCRQQ